MQRVFVVQFFSCANNDRGPVYRCNYFPLESLPPHSQTLLQRIECAMCLKIIHVLVSTAVLEVVLEAFSENHNSELDSSRMLLAVFINIHAAIWMSIIKLWIIVYGASMCYNSNNYTKLMSQPMRFLGPFVL